MKQSLKYAMLAGGVVLSYFAQKPPHTSANSPKSTTMQAQVTSRISLTSNGDEQKVDINNVTYEVTGDVVPGRPRGERLLLRKTASSRQVLGDIGQEATTTLEAWRLGADPAQKPLYTLRVSGTGGQTLDDALFVADRGLEEVAWWSVYRLGSGRHLFDTYVPLLSFSISPEILEMRYVGLEVPPDNSPDARLRRPEVVAVVTYASEGQVRREALLTCDNPAQAADLRSFPDTTRRVSVSDENPPRTLRISFRPTFQSPPAPADVVIPISNDDLDLAHAKLPAKMHVAQYDRRSPLSRLSTPH